MTRTIYQNGALSLTATQASNGNLVGILQLQGGSMVYPLSALRQVLADLARVASVELGLEASRVEGPAGHVPLQDGALYWHIDPGPDGRPVLHLEIPDHHIRIPLDAWAGECVNWIAVAQDLRRKERTDHAPN